MKYLGWIKAVLIVGVVVCCSCQSGTKWEGKYVSEPTADTPFPITLILKPDGKGFWMGTDQNTPFRWKQRKDAIWLHLKTGGVLIAETAATDDALTVDVPGQGSILFKKVPD
jgi:hypothetical protein